MRLTKAKTIKATVRCSGRVIEVFQQKDKFIEVGQDEEWKAEELDFAKDIDWQQVRIQAAIAAMQGLINGGIYTSSTFRLAQKRGQSGTEFIAQMANEFADDLIAELQKKGGQDDSNND